MAGTECYRVGGTGQVDIIARCLGFFHLLLQSVDLLKGCVLQFVDFTPTSFFWSAGTVRKSAIRALISPFLLRYLIRSCSTSSAFWAVKVLTSFKSSSIFLITYLYFIFLTAKITFCLKDEIIQKKVVLCMENLRNLIGL